MVSPQSLANIAMMQPRHSPRLPRHRHLDSAIHYVHINSIEIFCVLSYVFLVYQIPLCMFLSFLDV
jgi:hypothetical protein